MEKTKTKTKTKIRDGKSLADKTPVSSLMTHQVVCAEQEMDLLTLSRMFLELGISGAPVIDKAGRPVGVISKTDLVRHAFEQSYRTHKPRLRVHETVHPTRGSGPCVRDVMTPLAYSLTPEVSIARAAALMAFEGIHRIPIIDSPGGELVGILSSVDILRWIGEQDGYLRHSNGDDEAAVA